MFAGLLLVLIIELLFVVVWGGATWLTELNLVIFGELILELVSFVAPLIEFLVEFNTKLRLFLESFWFVN